MFQIYYREIMQHIILISILIEIFFCQFDGYKLNVIILNSNVKRKLNLN